MTTSPTKSINDLSRIYLTQVSEKKENPYSIKNKLKMAIKSVAEKERMKAGVTREEVENIDEKCWDGYEKKGMKTMFGKRYPNCVKKKAKKEDFSNWRDDLSDIVEVMHMTDDKAEKKIDDKKNIKNKVVINPKLSEAVKDMGGELLEVTEIEDVDEAKMEKGYISNLGKTEVRNQRRFGKKGSLQPQGYFGQKPSQAAELSKKRTDEHKARRGVKTKGMKENVEVVNEISDKLKKSYIKGATKEIDHLRKTKMTPMGMDTPSSDKVLKRKEGVGRAMGLMKKEEVEIEEKKMMAKVKLNPEKKIGVKVTDIGPGGKEVVRKNTMDEGVKGADPEMRKMAAQDRMSGKEKRLSKKAGDRNVANMTRKIEQGREMAMAKAYEEVELTEVKDKKGKGSGTKDACYHKVKSRYSVWPSAYASGALVKCRKVGAANWGNSKKESFSDWRSEFIWEDGDSEKKLTEDDMKGMSVKSGHKRPTKSGAGMTQKGVEAYRRRNPGSKLKTAVTTEPSKLKKGSKAANRRKSYCARSAGQMKKFPKAAKDPNSRLRQARRRWNC